MTERTLKTVHPMDVKVSELNERKNVQLDSNFEQNIAQIGVQEPPLVRSTSVQSYSYEVIAGQRRTLAAQNVGLDTMDVVVVDYSDAEALHASIIENMEEFKESVPLKDRAQAVARLREMNGWTLEDTADAFNVSSCCISTWLECMREEWEGTIIYGEEDGPIDVDDIAQEIFGIVRKQTGGGRSGEEAVALIYREDLSEKDVRQASELCNVDSSKSFLDHLEDISVSKRNKMNTDVTERVRVNATWTGDTAERLRETAANAGCTVQQYVEYVVSEDLTNAADQSTQSQNNNVQVTIDNF